MSEIRLKELVALHVIPSSGVVFDTFKMLFPDALYCSYERPSDYIKSLWQKYQAEGNPTNNKNGKVFESIFAALLYREKIYPLYVQAKIAFVPNVNFDFVIYSKEYGPVSLSLKVSLRERYKQADLEAITLKYVHRKSKSYLVTLDAAEAANVHKKIENGDVLGIDEVCVADSEALDQVIRELKTLTLHEPEEIQIITASNIIKPTHSGHG